MFIEFIFVKTDPVSKFLKVIFENILELGHHAPMIDAFKRMNMELNCNSSRVLSEYPKVSIPKNLPEEHANEIVNVLKEANVNRVSYPSYRRSSTSSTRQCSWKEQCTPAA